MAVGINPTNSLTYSGQINGNWFSFNDIKEPKILRQTVDKYGKDFETFEILDLMGGVMDMPNDIEYFYEKLSIERLITVDASGIAQTGAGAAITFTQNVLDFDSGAVTGNSYLRPNDVIVIPRQYLLNSTLFDAAYMVTTINASSGLITAIPYNNNSGSSAITTPTQLISAGVPAGTLLPVLSNAFGRGSSSPEGLTVQWFKRSFRTKIIREAFDIEGGNESDLWIDIALDTKGMMVPIGTPGARNGFIHLEQEIVDHNVNRSMNNDLLMAQLNDNTNLTQLNSLGKSTPVLGFQGIIPTAALLGQQAPYIGTLDASNFDDIIPLMIANGITGSRILGLCGDLYYKFFGKTMKEEIKQYGNDPIMTSMHDLGLIFKSFTCQGVNFNMRVLKNLSNPNNWGAAAFNDYYRKLAVLIPMETNDVRLGSENADNTKVGCLTLGFKNNKGENRRRVFAVVNGMTGQPYPILNDVDRIRGFVLSEFGLMYTKANQTVLQYGT